MKGRVTYIGCIRDLTPLSDGESWTPLTGRCFLSMSSRCVATVEHDVLFPTTLSYFRTELWTIDVNTRTRILELYNWGKGILFFFLLSALACISCSLFVTKDKTAWLPFLSLSCQCSLKILYILMLSLRIHQGCAICKIENAFQYYYCNVFLFLFADSVISNLSGNQSHSG